MEGLQLCSCPRCSSKRTFNPLTGQVFAGRYVGNLEFKEHRRQQNAIAIASGHIRSIRLPDDPSSNPLAPHSHVGHEEDISDTAGDPKNADEPQMEHSQVDITYLERLRVIKTRVQSSGYERLLATSQPVFRVTPLPTSQPMAVNAPRHKELLLAVSVPSNAPLINLQRLLQSARDITEIIKAASTHLEVQACGEDCLLNIESQESTLLVYKIQHWESTRLRMASLSSKARRISTNRYLARPFLQMHPFLLVCYLLVAYMHLICTVSLLDCSLLLIALRKLASLAHPTASSHAHGRLQADIPVNVRTVLSYLDLHAETTPYNCCPRCFALYHHDPDGSTKPPERCTDRPTKGSAQCKAPLYTKRKRKSSKKNEPIRLFLYHQLQEWVGTLYSKLDTEDLLDREYDPPQTDEVVDILYSPELRSFLGPEEDPTRPFLKRPGNEGRLVFGLNMDGFNPYSNKEAGKKVSVGAMYMVCLNLPLSIRFQVDNIFLVAVIPGPREPSKDQINHLLVPLVDDLLDLWFDGYFLLATPRHPPGRLVRGALVPLVCDLPASRQMASTASHAATNFCSLCTLTLSEIDNLDFKTWPRRSRDEHLECAFKWKRASSIKDREDLFKKSGIRWSELLRLPYWDPTRFVVVEAMHGFFLGMFQRHCREIWGMGVTIADVDYPSFARQQDCPSDERMKAAYQVFRLGDLEELQALEVPVLRQLARATNSLPFGGKGKNVLRDLIDYRVQRGWFNEDGELLDGIADPPSQQNIESNEIQDPNVEVESSMRRFHDEAQAFLDTLNSLPEKSQVLPTGKNSRNDPPTMEELASALKLLQSGSKRQLSSLRKAILLCLCRSKDIPVGQDQKNNVLVDALETWRLENGIINVHGGLIDPPRKGKHRRKVVGVLGEDTLKEVRDDMERLELPSWLPHAPRNPGEAKRGKFTADQWRTFCTINLTLTLNRLWGQEAEGSRRRRMLDNFMHLVTAVKIASMRKTTPRLIEAYTIHMHAYLVDLLEIYPNTALAPYQHLALHVPQFMEGFGPGNAWRCFAFERYNYLLQSTQTNMRFGELEKTMLHRFCMAQKLRSHLSPSHLPPELEDLVNDWDRVQRANIRGTLIHDNIAHDAFFQPMEETTPDPTLNHMEHLPQQWFALLKHWVARNDPVCKPSTLTNSALIRKRIQRLGETYQVEAISSNDSHVYYRTGPTTSAAGCIQGIITHTRILDHMGGARKERTETFFVVKQYQELPPVFEHADPYRRFPLVGGRLFRNAYYHGKSLISFDEVQHSFASARIDIPQIPFSCIVALPLDK